MVKEKGKRNVLEKIKYIEGPVSMTRHESRRYPHIFYILGDIHRRKLAGCPKSKVRDAAPLETIVQYLSKDNKYRHKLIDVFSEIGITEIKNSRYSAVAEMEHESPLDRFHLATRACLKQKKNKCWTTPGRVRVHAVDVRWVSTNVFYHLKSALSHLVEQYQRHSKAANLIKTAKLRLGPIIRDPNFKRYFSFEYMLSQPAVAKELKKLQDKKLRGDIIDYVRQQFNRRRGTAAAVRSMYRELLKGRWFAAVKDIRLSLTLMNTAMMDLYALARMFRTKWKDGAPPPRNIIVYVGEYHAKIYRGFLKSIGFDTEHAIVPGKKKATRCVQVFDDQPWFDRS